jgi:hypothetical protein
MRNVVSDGFVKPPFCRKDSDGKELCPTPGLAQPAAGSEEGSEIIDS